jgi:hypothetical protein
VGNNPLKYIDPIGHFPLISWDRFVHKVNAYKKDQRDLPYSPNDISPSIKQSEKVARTNTLSSSPSLSETVMSNQAVAHISIIYCSNHFQVISTSVNVLFTYFLTPYYLFLLPLKISCRHIQGW